MPVAKSARQFGFLGAVASGRARKDTSLTPAEARAGLEETPPAKREAFARVLARKRKRRHRRLGPRQTAMAGG